MTPENMVKAALEIQKVWGDKVKVEAPLFKIMNDGHYCGWIESRTGAVHAM